MASPEEETPSRLLSLPPELVILIAEGCSDDALVNLRRTCRTLDSASQDAFLDRFFSCRYTLLADQTSMENLIRITRHVRLCKRIKHLRFSLATLPNRHEQRVEALAEKNGRVAEPRRTRFFLGTPSYCEVQAWRDLRVVFQNVTRNCDAEVPHLSLADVVPDYESRDLPTAHQRLSAQFGYDKCLGFKFVHYPDPYMTFLFAMGLSRYPVTSLEMGSDRCTLHLRSFERTSGLQPSSLRQLKLTLARHSGEEEHMKAFLKFLHQATQLESFVLVQVQRTAQKDFQHGLFGKFNSCAKENGNFLPSLKTFRFEGFVGDPALLEALKTLRSITLSQVTSPGFAASQDDQ